MAAFTSIQASLSNTSHQAFITHEALTEIARVTTENILGWERGQPFLPGTTL